MKPCRNQGAVSISLTGRAEVSCLLEMQILIKTSFLWGREVFACLHSLGCSKQGAKNKIERDLNTLGKAAWKRTNGTDQSLKHDWQMWGRTSFSKGCTFPQRRPVVAIPILKKGGKKKIGRGGRERKKEIIMGCELPRNSCAIQGISALLNDSQQLKAS